jgi:hypothetical protein
LTPNRAAAAAAPPSRSMISPICMDGRCHYAVEYVNSHDIQRPRSLA